MRDREGDAESEGVPDWRELGGSAQGGGVSESGGAVLNKSVHVDATGTVYVTWSDESSGNMEVYLRYFDGSSWQGLGGSGEGAGVSNDVGESKHAGVGFDLQQRPHVVWENILGSDNHIFLKWWDGDSWEQLGGSAAGEGISPGGEAEWPDIAFDDNGRPAVAWQDYTSGGGANPYVKYWESGQWRELDGSASQTGVSGGEGNTQFVSLAAVPGLFAAWDDNRTGASEIYLVSWNGSSWIDLGGSSASGGLSATGNQSWFTNLGVGEAGFPAVCWHEDAGSSRQAMAKYWDGVEWSVFGPSASLTDAGVAPDPSTNPECAFDVNGYPIAMWEEDDPVGHNIHGARYNGSEWLDLDPVDVAGGISNSSSTSAWPSVAVSNVGVIYVAWEETIGPGLREVYLKELR